jgi:hypothetical protein
LRSYAPQQTQTTAENALRSFVQPVPLQATRPRQIPFASHREGGLPHFAAQASPRLRIQPKLVVGKTTDPAEEEADRVADQVMRMPDRKESVAVRRDKNSCDCKDPHNTAPPKVQLKSAHTSESSGVEAPSIVDEVLSSPGEPLGSSARAFFEPRFGRDFSAVRVHNEPRAVESAEIIGAQAYTVGNNLVFGQGRYAPDTVSGQRLLAHELSHSVQQTKGPLAVQRACDRNIFSEGTCQYLTTHSRFICCDPTNGLERPERSTDIEGKNCPSHKFTPIFTCDANCPTALRRGCNDADNWMAIPGDKFTRAACNTTYTICANGRQTTGYVRDRSVTAASYEVSPGIQQALGATVGSSFVGAIYRPGASTDAINRDSCCHTAAPPAAR